MYLGMEIQMALLSATMLVRVAAPELGQPRHSTRRYPTPHSGNLTAAPALVLALTLTLSLLPILFVTRLMTLVLVLSSLRVLIRCQRTNPKLPAP